MASPRLEDLPFVKNTCYKLGVRIRLTLRDLDPLNKVTFKRATSRVQKGPL